MLKDSIKKVVERLSGGIPNAYTYVFDGDLEEFIYQSESNEILEKTILDLNRDKGLADLVNESTENLAQLDCETTNRKFLIKRLATDLYFGMCVDQDPKVVNQAIQTMYASIKVPKS